MKLIDFLEVAHIDSNNIIIEKENEFCSSLSYLTNNMNVTQYNEFLQYKVLEINQNKSLTIKIKVY